MKKVNLKGKKIRLFFHTDLDGTVAALLIKQHSGADIVKLVPVPYQNWRKGDRLADDVLDVFVDCRSANQDEDIRIDHHAAGEKAAYLKRAGVIVDTKFASAVSLVAKYLGIKVDKKVLKEMDLADSGKPNVFTKFTMDDHTIHRILFDPGLTSDDLNDYERFKDKMLGFMVKGFAVEDLGDTPEGYEKKMEKKFGVVVEDIKKPGKPFVKLVHSPPKTGLFKSAFKISDREFFGHVFPYVNQHYYNEAKLGHLGVYMVVGFRAHNEEFDENLVKVVKDTHPEPFQIFAARSHEIAGLDIGKIIAAAKEHTGITNGGGRDSVGGLNTADKDKAIKALKFIVDYIREHCP